MKPVDIIEQYPANKKIQTICEKIFNLVRISEEEALILYEKAELALLGVLSDFVKKTKNENKVYYIRNFHIEPTNICVYNCKFCSFSRKAEEDGSWYLTEDRIIENVKQYCDKNISEVHIVGGTHPEFSAYYFAGIIRKIRELMPDIHIKAFTAVELDYMISRAGLTIQKGLELLKEAGLDSIPGGGAEIFDETIRKEICPRKTSSKKWLEIHETAHELGIPSNATMLYGHIENYSHRVDHLSRLRDLQDKTLMFNAFIPLKYKKANNNMSFIGEVNTIEDLRNYAMSRIFLDNFPHIKTYWPMMGKETAQLSLSFGVDDMDGTINDSTKIYSMAGGDTSPVMTTSEIKELIKTSNLQPVERNGVYNAINT